MCWAFVNSINKIGVATYLCFTIEMASSVAEWASLSLSLSLSLSVGIETLRAHPLSRRKSACRAAKQISVRPFACMRSARPTTVVGCGVDYRIPRSRAATPNCDRAGSDETAPATFTETAVPLARTSIITEIIIAKEAAIPTV